MKQLLDLVYAPLDQWDSLARPAFADALEPRYHRIKKEPLLDTRGEGEKRFQLRVNAKTDAKNVPYAALLPQEQDTKGAYGGMSFVLFPSREDGVPALICMAVGTNGLPPDEDILGRPGHARKVRAIASWLRANDAPFTWAKKDPTRIDMRLPKTVKGQLADWGQAYDRYGNCIYGVFCPPRERSDASDALVLQALSAWIDLFFDERRIDVKKAFKDESESTRRAWMATTLPGTTDEDIASLLERRKYVVLEGPPGTGKTELATRLLRDRYKMRGRVIQFHPGTTYETFIGGLAPERAKGGMGFAFAPKHGHLMEAVIEARSSDEPYLLVVDEINRADIAKVLGEAIYLFEPGRHDRIVSLHHEFPEVGRALQLPPNLHLLGTMNSADRSIAILDLAVRRRFAFVPLWPQLTVVEEHGGPLMQQAFHDLLSCFLEHATDEAISLMPGHAYFLADDDDAGARLRTEVAPLLREYLAQGYVAAFADEVQAWLDTHGELRA